ncbi:MAG: DNA mismatch repair endonuclease MutL [Nitrospirota bacterium]|nr:DNA mismatch repair endonuclease MutL [Nitrospirota bacterium]
MPEIRVLPEELQNRIAAGEVIERPASVVKELIENSIDAGATEVVVDILNGGRRLIRISDNGRGMEREDALICFYPHATSKISTEEDLFDIRTLGFRGEALSSIASVSRLKILTAPSGSTLGVSQEIHGGELKEVKDVAHSGTTIEVNDLFFNTPARKKFLKSQRTEVYHIVETVTVAGLSHPDVAFFLTIDRAETLMLPVASGIRERVLQIYGEEFLRGLREVKESNSRALISVEGNFRSSRANQYIFVNHRPIRDAALRHAVYSAYDTFLPRDRHPIFFLYLDIVPSEVDFNVHPAKREVRFSDREAVYRTVYNVVREALTGSGEEDADYGVETDDAPDGLQPATRNPQPVTSVSQPATPVLQPAIRNPQPATPDAPLVAESLIKYGNNFRYIYLGDVFVAYTDGRGITLLDHHAAHERILYERLRKGIGLDVTYMLFPKQVRLPAREYKVLLHRLDEIKEMGIEAEDFGHNTLMVRAVPQFLFDADMAGILSDVAFCLIESTASSPIEDIRDRIAKRIACHSSVRGAVMLSHDEIARLLDDLSEAEDPEHCPHGRPTRIHMSLEDLKRMFKRTG